MNEEIRNLLYRFANSFDLKAWLELQGTLADKIECDYSSLRGYVGVVTKEDYVKSREVALNELNTQHLLSNIEIHPAGDKATCLVNAVIFRQKKSGITFNSHVFYQFEVALNEEQSWKICKIKQTVFWNEGDASIHTGVKQDD